MVGFDCTASSKAIPDDMPPEYVLQGGGLCVSPEQMTILPEKSVALKIKYLPGICGEFNETIYIEVIRF